MVEHDVLNKVVTGDTIRIRIGKTNQLVLCFKYRIQIQSRSKVYFN